MTKTPPRPLLNREAHEDGIIHPSEYLPKRMELEGLKTAKANNGVYQVQIPDAVIMRNPAISDLTVSNLKTSLKLSSMSLGFHYK